MIIMYVFLFLVAIDIIVSIGKINMEENVKRKILTVCSIVYNVFWGFADTMVAIILYAFFSNQPKGSGYSVPDSEIGFNRMIGFIVLGIYLILLIPINIYMKKRGEIKTKFYVIANIIATIVGFVIFWIFYKIVYKNKAIF